MTNRALVPSLVKVSHNYDFIGTRQSVTFSARLSPAVSVFAYGSAVAAGLTALAATVFIAWYASLIGVLVVTLAVMLPRLLTSRLAARQFRCPNTYSGTITQQAATFVELHKLQEEIRSYLTKNVVADLHRERFNNLTSQANGVYSYLLTQDLEPREDALMLAEAEKLARDLRRKLDALYEDLLRQAELDPHVSKYGELLESMRNQELRASDQEELEYQELNANYKRMIESAATDPRDYYHA